MHGFDSRSYLTKDFRYRYGESKEENYMSMDVSIALKDIIGKTNQQRATHHRLQVTASPLDSWHWRAVKVWTMTAEEMRRFWVEGQTACFVVLLDQEGQVIRGVGNTTAIRYGIEGQFTRMSPFEKQYPEPLGNFVMGAGGRFWVEIEDDLYSSDTVTGITLQNPDDTDPLAHHTTVVAFQACRAEDEAEPSPEQSKLDLARSLAKQLLDVLESV